MVLSKSNIQKLVSQHTRGRYTFQPLWVSGWNKQGVAEFKMGNLELWPFGFRYRFVKNAFCFRQDLNLRPSACEADVINHYTTKTSTTLWGLTICTSLRSMKFTNKKDHCALK